MPKIPYPSHTQTILGDAIRGGDNTLTMTKILNLAALFAVVAVLGNCFDAMRTGKEMRQRSNSSQFNARP